MRFLEANGAAQLSSAQFFLAHRALHIAQAHLSEARRVCTSAGAPPRAGERPVAGGVRSCGAVQDGAHEP